MTPSALENSVIPVVLFAYARPHHLQRTLACLRENQVPLIYAFSDGPRTPDIAPKVVEVRQILRAIDWCEVRLVEREQNLGLGVSIRAGVSSVLEKHDAAIVFEDDLICVPGTYQYLCAALNHYKDEPKVMSVTGWTHPRVTPRNVGKNPYFDGRAECLVWGTWARGWQGMDQNAMTLMRQCSEKGINPYLYGADLAAMAEIESVRNIWAVRFLYLHIVNNGLCLRPPHSMVEHIGFDSEGTNSKSSEGLENPPLQPAPLVPTEWPIPILHPDCSKLWQREFGSSPLRKSFLARLLRRSKREFRSLTQKIGFFR